MELIDAIKKRVSVRNYSDKPISDEIITEMLDVARLAPTPGNGQGHVYGVVKDKELITQLAQAAGDQMWIATAPVVFAICGDISWDIADQSEDDFGLQVNYLRFGRDFIQHMNQYPDRKTVMKLFDNGMPLGAEHIFLTAVSHGLSACYIGYLDTEKASRILELPENIVCFYLLPVGYPKEAAEPPKKKSIEEISFMDTWTNSHVQSVCDGPREQSLCGRERGQPDRNAEYRRALL
jgi:nitroreductase